MVELYPVIVKSYVGALEEFKCSYTYKGTQRLKIEFVTQPPWSWLTSNMTFQSTNQRLPLYPRGMKFPLPKWDNKITARIPMFPLLEKVICRITDDKGEALSEMSAMISTGLTITLHN